MCLGNILAQPGLRNQIPHRGPWIPPAGAASGFQGAIAFQGLPLELCHCSPSTRPPSSTVRHQLSCLDHMVLKAHPFQLPPHEPWGPTTRSTEHESSCPPSPANPLHAGGASAASLFSIMQICLHDRFACSHKHIVWFLTGSRKHFLNWLI